MARRFDTIGLVGKYGDAKIARTLADVGSYLRQRGLTVLVDEGVAELMGESGPDVVNRPTIGERADLAIVVGGDGTLLHSARALAPYEVPLLGINMGRLGFLVDVSPDQAAAILDEVLRGDYREEERFMLHAEIWRDGELANNGDALNDVVVHNWNGARMIEFETYVNGQFVNAERADGLIVSTPTGSTAYALSAGGPLLHPKLNALVLAPICPHTLSNRPIVVDGDSVVEVVVCKNIFEAQATFDGQVSIGLVGADRVRMCKKGRPLRLIHPANYDHFALLRAKLHWGRQPRC